MLSNETKLISIEGVLLDLLLKLEKPEAQNLGIHDPEKRRRKLLKMALTELGKLDGDSAAMSMEPVAAPGGSDLSYFLRHFN